MSLSEWLSISGFTGSEAPELWLSKSGLVAQRGPEYSNKEKEEHKMFEIREVSNVEATGSLVGSAISCAGTWGAVFLLCGALAC